MIKEIKVYTLKSNGNEVRFATQSQAQKAKEVLEQFGLETELEPSTVSVEI